MTLPRRNENTHKQFRGLYKPRPKKGRDDEIEAKFRKAIQAKDTETKKEK
jgi:hypothetical protein